VSEPLVSICLPTYNYARFLPQAIQSVLAQTVGDFELLVYDDASTDDTVAVMQPFLDDERVKLIVQEQNQGIFANFNQSFGQARGRYIKFLCADDWLEPTYLEKTLPLFEQMPDLSLVTTAHWHANEEGQHTATQYGPFGDGPRVPAELVARRLARWGNVIGMPTNTLIRRDLLVKVEGFDAEYAPGADVQLWLKLLAEGDMGWVPEKLCTWRIHGNHTHSYGDDPTESTFRVWRDAGSIPGSPATTEICRIGTDHHATVTSQYAFAHLLAGRPKAAAKLIGMAKPYVGLPRMIALFLRALPSAAVDQTRRIRASRSGRALRYAPRPELSS
jgi:glycosyltransferase involved in cell wall biosynthesis